MKKYKEYAMKFKVALGILVAGLVIFIVLITQITPLVQKNLDAQKEYKQATEKLSDLERKLENLKKETQRKTTQKENLTKAIFKPSIEGLDAEAAIAKEFGEILQILRENKLKTRALRYDYDPQDDNFVKNAASKYHVCRITADMIATYSNFENFLRDLYKHEHFLEISKIEIVPYQKNKRILLINAEIKLYSQKN